MSFVVAEHLDGHGGAVPTALASVDDGLAVLVGGAPLGVVAPAAVVVVLRRYGRPLDPSVAATVDGPWLPLPGGARLARLRWRAAVDAAARDWIVLDEPGRERIAALSPAVGAALRHLATAGRAG